MTVAGTVYLSKVPLAMSAHLHAFRNIRLDPPRSDKTCVHSGVGIEVWE
jgi:hypothetical protein